MFLVDAPTQILLVEDNPVDILMIRECLKKWELKNDVYVVEDGEQALDFLNSRGRFVGSPKPDLVLLDLNLPKTAGSDVLLEISKNPKFASAIVVVVTSFDPIADLRVWKDLGAALCITKPWDYDEYFQVIKDIEKFWMTGDAIISQMGAP